MSRSDQGRSFGEKQRRRPADCNVSARSSRLTRRSRNQTRADHARRVDLSEPATTTRGRPFPEQRFFPLSLAFGENKLLTRISDNIHGHPRHSSHVSAEWGEGRVSLFSKSLLSAINLPAKGLTGKLIAESTDGVRRRTREPETWTLECDRRLRPCLIPAMPG
jgi:hypothetical protein